MVKVGLIRFFILLFVASPALAQKKIKYKDIFGLLSTKQYDEAEPFLKQYLQENDDNPNAFLFMGAIYQEKATRNDILKQTSLAVRNMDSACYYYDRANKTIDDRELRKNKEYYQSYNRRDLRTGEFGVTLSDIQFDLEKKMEGLRERIDRVKMVKYYFSFADSLYKKSNELFTTLQRPYAHEKAFFLRSDEHTVQQLTALAARFDSAMKFFDHYRASLQNLGNPGYSQLFKLQDITDFKKDGTQLADLYQQDVMLWDYKKFAARARETIEKEIMPMRTHLVEYDVELNKLREKLQQDSVSVRNDLTKLIDKLLNEQLRKFDDDPLPMNIFAMKITDLEYKSLRLENSALRDSANVYLQLDLARKEMKYLDRLDSVTARLDTVDLEKRIPDYAYFVSNTYNNSVILKSYIKAVKEYAEREKKKAEENLVARENALRWIVAEPDSIPLFSEGTMMGYRPLIVEENKYTTGLRFADSLSASGYFYTITPSRVPDVRASFSVDKDAFKESRLSSVRALAMSANDLIYYLLIFSGEPVKNKYPATVTKVYRSDGWAWSVNNQLPFMPAELVYKQDTGELIIKGDQQTLVLDKNGAVKK